MRNNELADHYRIPLIYNLFPRLAGTFDQWIGHARRARAMGFNWLYLNPISYPGFSGSLYAVKDPYRLNPDFIPSSIVSDALQSVEPVIRAIAALGLHPMIDLVVNHTAVDSPLLIQHPEWFQWEAYGAVRHPCAVDPVDPSKKTIWGDLAEVDNSHAPNREALWAYWADVLKAYLLMGFEGIRCDAAYQVPVELWCYLMERAREINPRTVFFAENLGCTLEQMRALRHAGFHFFCNSSKWWDFREDWCLQQQHEFADLASISFPETHDTPRLARETHGNERIQRLRYGFAAVFSTGIMMPIGYEFGFQRNLHVVTTQPMDWETPTFDLCAFVAAVNELKRCLPILQGEGHIRAVVSPIEGLIILERRTLEAPGEVGWIVINTDPVHSRLCIPGDFIHQTSRLTLYRLAYAEQPSAVQEDIEKFTVAPSEIVLITGR
ncbi:MAG: alpha-amylase [Nitrospirae bacterium]|nr:MAG: alpha-amylase [Nitrospirota bacterium]